VCQKEGDKEMKREREVWKEEERGAGINHKNEEAALLTSWSTYR
jgi:hypothetical protein